VLSTCNRGPDSRIHASSTSVSPLQVSPTSARTLAPAAAAKNLPTILPSSRSPEGTADRLSSPSPSPLVITREQIDALRGLPLPRAAGAVGISATAFKRACRRLGVARWDYKRGPGRRPYPSAADPAGRSTPAGRLTAAAKHQSRQALGTPNSPCLLDPGRRRCCQASGTPAGPGANPFDAGRPLNRGQGGQILSRRLPGGAAGLEQASAHCHPPPPCRRPKGGQGRPCSEMTGPAWPEPCLESAGEWDWAGEGAAWVLEVGQPEWWDSEGRADSDDALVLAMLALPWPDGAP
jgi:hypothetical protein